MRTIEDMAFPVDEYRGRLESLRSATRTAGLDLLILTAPENICYFSGYESAGYFAFQVLLIAVSGEPVLVVRSLETPNAEASSVFDRIIGYQDHESGPAIVARAVAELGARDSRIGVELRSRSLSNAQLREIRDLLPEAVFTDSFGIAERLRLLKSERELAHIRAAGRIVDQAMDACMAAAQPGRRERDLAAVAYETAILAGSEWTGAPAFIASGSRSARAHTTWSDRMLAPGDPVFLEVNASVRRYHAALMRPVCIAPVPMRFRAMTDASLAGLEAALDAVAPGVSAAAIDEACRRAIDRLGWGEYFRLRTGYSMGLGFENFGEGSLLSLHAENNTEIQKGMVLHLVPYLAEAGVAGCAYSETVIVTQNGAEPVSHVPRELRVGQ